MTINSDATNSVSHTRQAVFKCEKSDGKRSLPQQKLTSGASDVLDRPGYAYYHVSESPQKVRHKVEAEALSREILYPKLHDPNFLVLRARRRIFSRFTQNTLNNRGLRVLDVGGRLQAYRLLFKGLVGLYVAIDPVFEGLINVIAVGECLPFPDDTFDLVICTQVLNYSTEPSRLISEIHRVLKKESFLFLSVPAICPRYHDQRWRFMPEGLLVLLASFSDVEIIPEGFSIAGLFRSLNLFLDTFVRSERLRGLVASTVFPVTNIAGLLLDRFSKGNSQFTTNYSCTASKRTGSQVSSSKRTR